MVGTSNQSVPEMAIEPEMKPDHIAGIKIMPAHYLRYSMAMDHHRRKSGISGWATKMSTRGSTNHNWLVVTGTMEFYDFPYIGKNDPNWRTHIFQDG